MAEEATFFYSIDVISAHTDPGWVEHEILAIRAYPPSLPPILIQQDLSTVAKLEELVPIFRELAHHSQKIFIDNTAMVNALNVDQKLVRELNKHFTNVIFCDTEVMPSQRTAQDCVRTAIADGMKALILDSENTVLQKPFLAPGMQWPSSLKSIDFSEIDDSMSPMSQMLLYFDPLNGPKPSLTRISLPDDGFISVDAFLDLLTACPCLEEIKLSSFHSNNRDIERRLAETPNRIKRVEIGCADEKTLSALLALPAIEHVGIGELALHYEYDCHSLLRRLRFAPDTIVFGMPSGREGVIFIDSQNRKSLTVTGSSDLISEDGCFGEELRLDHQILYAINEVTVPRLVSLVIKTPELRSRVATFRRLLQQQGENTISIRVLPNIVSKDPNRVLQAELNEVARLYPGRFKLS